jgi:tetratricopeptide (TPR) repeat protein
VEKAQWASAAAEFERMAANHKDPAIARGALWQAAELYEKANARTQATKAYERYIAQNPQPLEAALEARWRLSVIFREEHNPGRDLALMRDIFQADQGGGSARTDRTRYLGARAALALAEPVADAYRKVALTEPLQKQLKLKKARMEDALKAYTVATDYGVADVTTEASYRIALVYSDFGKALLASQRPRKLNKLEREQYDVLLEEQAFPFEEKAADMHTQNVQRASKDHQDPWMQRSAEALRQLRPGQYKKAEQQPEKTP